MTVKRDITNGSVFAILNPSFNTMQIITMQNPHLVLMAVFVRSYASKFDKHWQKK